MFLKSFLMEHGYSAKKLKVDFYHDVKKLWKEYKNLTKNSALKAHDEVIKDINVVEKLRYPNKSYTFATEHQKGPKSKVTGPMTKGFVQCHRAGLVYLNRNFGLISGTSAWFRPPRSAVAR